MRLLCCIFVFFSPLFITAQNCEIPINSKGKFEIQKVIPMEGIKKEKLFSSANLALVETLNTPIDFIKIYDIEEGVILSDIVVETSSSIFTNYVFRFEIKLEFKDSRYRMTLNYLDNQFITSDGTICYCQNNITQERCLPYGCLLSKKSWGIAKCTALERLNEKVQDLEADIFQIAKGKDSQW